MDNGKVFGSDGILINVWKCVEEQCIICFTELFNEILNLRKCQMSEGEILWFLIFICYTTKL